MTDNNNPTQAGTSANSIQNPYSSHPSFPMFPPTYSTGSNVLPYGNYSSWSNPWTSNYASYTSMAINPALHAKMPPYGTGYNPPQPLQSSSSITTAPARANTPPLPDPDSYRHWDDVLKAFLDKTNLTQCRRGFELDVLVLNSEWEQRTLPEALKDLVRGMQVILDRISGKAGDTEIQVEKNNTTPIFEERSLDERKLDYIPLKDGKKPELQSSITRSISTFLARSRARNDLSNRAEFLQTLAEQKQASSAGIVAESSCSATIDGGVQESFSCARVDAKMIDRAKQIKYDIMKNEDGPLTRTVPIKAPPSDLHGATQSLSESAIIASSSTSAVGRLSPPLHPRKRRRLADVEDSTKNSSKTKSKATEGQPPVLLPQDETDGISATLVPAVDARIRNIEEHLSVRYVPSPPQMLLTRLKYLEDHLIRLEKEYPPWAALHFKQPNRGWPPPPRSTPIIVPPHLRSANGKQSSGDPVDSPALLPEVHGQPSVGSTKAKSRHKNSTLHKAVMDRLEIQQAMNEMGLQ